jgi:hypothetical protein
MTPQEETVILEAHDILGRYLSQNPVIGSWQALMDYCALTVRGPTARLKRTSMWRTYLEDFSGGDHARFLRHHTRDR